MRTKTPKNEDREKKSASTIEFLRNVFVTFRILQRKEVSTNGKRKGSWTLVIFNPW